MSTPVKQRKIFEYLDYREFLKDYYEFKKEHTNGFSYRTFSNRIGFKTKDFILRVMQGKRNLSDSSARAIALGIKLDKRESLFFLALVSFNQASSAKEREEAHNSMSKILDAVHFQNEQHRLKHYQYEIYSKWYVLAVRSILGLWGFGGDFQKLAQSLHPAISEEEAKHAVELLLKCHLIQEDSKQGYILTHESITTGDFTRMKALRNYHQNFLQLATESIENDPADQRNISALTLGISQKVYDEIVLRLGEFRKEIAQLAQQDVHADRVMQLNFQLFPISQQKKD